MKSFYYLLLICCFSLTKSNSQETIKKNKNQRFTFGVNVGGHYSYLGGESGYKDYYNKNTINYLAGINAEIKINECWSVYTNLDYKKKSFKSHLVFASGGGGPLEVENQLVYTYIDLPIMAKYRVKNSFMYFTGGIYLAKLLTAKVFVDSNSSVQDLRDSTEDIDNGIILGGGFIFYENEKETSNMSIEVRYTHGISDIIRQSEGQGSTLLNSYSLQLNYNFTL